MAALSVYTFPPSPANWDKIGVFYISWCASWTALLIAGMVFCWFNRHLPALKIRGLPLSFSAIAFLHIYWILAQITYPIGATMPLVLAYDIQYFFMSLWFPLGIALFHASNLRFLRVARLQKQFTHPARRAEAGCNGAKTSWLCRLRNMDYTQRSMLFIGLGMIIQVLLTVGMWLACRKYHPTYGIPGTELRGATIPEQLVDLGRGWEWWPSVLWQVIWTWIIAPFLIWRAWGIRDTMGWRAQTIGCCISNLHATPMFLISSYVPIFEKVNKYFTPSQWIHLSILMFEIFTVFVPVFQVFRFWVQRRKATRSNAKWESPAQTATLTPSSSEDWIFSPITLNEKGKSLDIFNEDLGDRLLTMSALELILNENPGPLQEFSALRDFSGENIAFLTSVAKWKLSLDENMSDEKKREIYNGALDIYIDYISPRDAEFPLNLSSSEIKRVENIFEKAARIVCGEQKINPATPFDVEITPFRCCEAGGPFELTSRTTPRTKYEGEVPGSFDGTVFDSIQSHIKYLVLTNTWPKFVDEMQARKRRSSETGRSAGTWKSSSTITDRIIQLVRQII
ncbi:type G- coupled receptor [Trichoderma arundinaceum]|uniref:Type G-coupled receptor n=1 Tax=Trichoderma arundinaceum TaxID=490622 RepID=A0A395NPC2_TRIAR|nr:type G- coupled receptor [Trichoderma arundinaceum]